MLVRVHVFVAVLAPQKGSVPVLLTVIVTVLVLAPPAPVIAEGQANANATVI